MSRLVSTLLADSADQSEDFVSIFPTEIGWMAIVGHANVVQCAFVGHPSAASARKVVKNTVQAIGDGQSTLEETDWSPELREMLEDYARGSRVTFEGFDLRLPSQTPFRNLVLAATRRLEYGATITYGELAKLVGHPRAARAVGTVMSTNRFPILIPCHRVMAAGGKLGGYTSPTGTGLKERLLELERAN